VFLLCELIGEQRNNGFIMGHFEKVFLNFEMMAENSLTIASGLPQAGIVS